MKDKTYLKDTSPIIRQREKFKGEFGIKEFRWTEKQLSFIRTALDKNTKIIICKSPPGTGKTLLSLFCALKRLQEKKSGGIFFVRNPIESASKSIGFIPGDISMKMEWVVQPLMDQLNQLLNPKDIQALIQDERIEGVPLGHLKGRTFINSDLIADEAEDFNATELLLTMCRIGLTSKVYILGDIKQANIRNSGFELVYDLFNNEESKNKGIHTIEFTTDDIMRHDVIKFIVDKFETLNLKPSGNGNGNGHK